MGQGGYKGDFERLVNHLGLTEKAELRNISYHSGRFRFDIASHGYSLNRIRGVSGTVSRAGIRVNLGSARGEYGRPKSFFKRRNDDCRDL